MSQRKTCQQFHFIANVTYLLFAVSAQPSGKQIVLAEFGSFQLELVRLSQITGDPSYAEHALRIIEKIAEVTPRLPGLYPMLWDLDTFRPEHGKCCDHFKEERAWTVKRRTKLFYGIEYITISGGTDSYYEYLLKTHMLMGGQEELQLDMWTTAVNSMKKHLRSQTSGGKVYLGEYNGNIKLLQSGELVRRTKVLPMTSHT